MFTFVFFFFSSRRRHTRFDCDWSSDVCSSDLMMQAVVQHGSGWTSRIPGFQLDQCGKTGTSQIPVNGKYTDDVWASFVGFLPAKKPRFTMLVVVHKPHYPGSDGDWTLNDG